jgi:hypothetical protein
MDPAPSCPAICLHCDHPDAFYPVQAHRTAAVLFPVLCMVGCAQLHHSHCSGPDSLSAHCGMRGRPLNPGTIYPVAKAPPIPAPILPEVALLEKPQLKCVYLKVGFYFNVLWFLSLRFNPIVFLATCAPRTLYITHTRLVGMICSFRQKLC